MNCYHSPIRTTKDGQIWTVQLSDREDYERWKKTYDKQVQAFCYIRTSKSGEAQLFLRPKQKMLVSCNMPKKVSVGRSAFVGLFVCFFVVANRYFVGKIGEKSGLQKKNG